ncbi:hypothetical protein Tsubulata_009219 [Turnera subulata]|uniref:Uncharacterized protein n=1 Tax=Turnera subulata TaxID=218843 RepID=A0A9Q0F2L1_9ROSI|nr:hypothetical protein Tsubulata_009219 [Turnera subulata]
MAIRKQPGAGFPVGRVAESRGTILGRKRRHKKKPACKCSNDGIVVCTQSLRALVSSSSPWHGVFAFLNPLLVGVIQVKFQGKTDSPFDSRPLCMWVFVSATVVYCFALASKLRFYGSVFYSKLSGDVALLSGSLSSVALVSILLPQLAGWVLSIAWTLFPMILAHKLIRHMVIWIHKGIMILIFQIRRVILMNKTHGNSSIASSQLPTPL